jgi:hypothetical protein
MDRACLECTICGFILDDVVAHKFGVDLNELFIMDYVPETEERTGGGMAMNSNAITPIMHEKYIPAFADAIYDTSPILSLLQKEMKKAEKKMQDDLWKDLMNPIGFK